MKQHLQIALDHEPLAWINGVVYSNRPAWYNVTARALHMDLIVPKERPHHAPQRQFCSCAAARIWSWTARSGCRS